MSGMLSSIDKALLDFYLAAWWQLYLGSALLGLVSGLCVAAWIREVRQLRLYASLIRLVLYFAAFSALATITLTLARENDSPWTGICFMDMRFAWFFVDGVLLAAMVTSFDVIKGLPSRDNTLTEVLLLPENVWAAQLSLASQYVTAGLLKILTRESLDFFHQSGYSTTFFFFIAVWEVFGGLGLMLRRLAMLALVALSIDMLGAIFTHYHNYFTRELPGPFGNSLDALRMLFLMAYVAFALRHERRSHVASALKGFTVVCGMLIAASPGFFPHVTRAQQPDSASPPVVVQSAAPLKPNKILPPSTRGTPPQWSRAEV
jgi:uncharacterized membrane protein YphA (DoxX/SURF4 family)